MAVPHLPSDPAPFLVVERGTPTDDELAALTAALLLCAGPRADAAEEPEATVHVPRVAWLTPRPFVAPGAWAA